MAIKHLGANSRGGDMTESQDDKYLKHNDHIDLLADATQRKMNLFVGISSGNTLTLGAEDFTENFVFHCRDEPGSPTLDGEWVLQVPATMRHFAVINDTSFKVFVESAGSPGNQIAVNVGGRADLHSDGESVTELKRDVYDFQFFAEEIVSGTIVGAVIAVTDFRLPAGLSESAAHAYTTSGGGENDVVLSIQKNESEVGTITFAAATATATLAMASDQSFSAASNDRLRVIFPDESPTQITTLAQVVVGLKAVSV